VHFRTLQFIESCCVGLPKAGKVLFSRFGCELAAIVDKAVLRHENMLYGAIKTCLSPAHKSGSFRRKAKRRIMALTTINFSFHFRISFVTFIFAWLDKMQTRLPHRHHTAFSPPPK